MDLFAAKKSDAKALARFSEETFRDAFEALNPKEDFNTYVKDAFTPDRIQKEIENPLNRFFIAAESSKWVGYFKLFQGPPPKCVNPVPSLELARLYAAKPYWGSGVGQFLIRSAVSYAREKDFKSLWLSSWMENHRGNAFYKKMGFKIVGTRPFILGNDIQNDHVFLREMN